MISQLETRYFIRELQTDGHSPAMFICSDDNIYFIKYRSGNSINPAEINCLVFEMVCSRLLRELEIPTPDLSLILVKDGSFSKDQIKINKRYLIPGIIGLGSKEIKYADILKNIEKTKGKWDYNKLLNPFDLLKISIFDLWVDNRDRNGDNYNIISQMQSDSKKLMFFAIDHAFAFGGLNNLSTFTPNMPISLLDKLIESQYFKSILHFINKEERYQIANNFLSLLRTISIDDIITDVFTSIPHIWGIDPNIQNRIVEFLVNATRIDDVEQIVLSRFLR